MADAKDTITLINQSTGSFATYRMVVAVLTSSRELALVLHQLSDWWW